MTPFENQLHHTFENPAILREALTHSSLRHEARGDGSDNQRLEFIGDAVLQMLCTEFLFRLYPQAKEGELTQRRAQMVNRQTMGLLAEKMGLGAELFIGKGEECSGGRTRLSNLADAMEAVLGALYLDGGWEVCRHFCDTEMIPFWNSFSNAETLTNPKGWLQEKIQSLSLPPPVYSVVEMHGPDHARQYIVSLEWCGKEIGRGTGKSKKEAEVNAAATALQNDSWLEQTGEQSPTPQASRPT